MNNINIFANYCRRLSPTRVQYIFKKNNIPLNSLNNNMLQSTSFNIFLSNLNIYRYFFLHVDIVINYYNNTYKKFSLMKAISKNNSNKYINIDLTPFIKAVDLNNFRILFIDVYTKDILIYFSRSSILKTPYINLKFHTLKSLNSPNVTTNFNSYYSKNDAIDIPSYIRPFNQYSEIPTDRYSNTNKINDVVLNENSISPPSPYKPIDIRKLFYKYKKKKFYYLIKKFINKYITVKVEFNGTKILNGTLDKVDSDTITLIDNDYKHIICTDSISIISSNEHINTDNLLSKIEYSDISVVLNYLKDNEINLKLNDKDLNISTVRIVNSCDSFLEVEDIETKKTYYLNLDYIKTIESIPNKN